MRNSNTQQLKNKKIYSIKWKQTKLKKVMIYATIWIARAITRASLRNISPANVSVASVASDCRATRRCETRTLSNKQKEITWAQTLKLEHGSDVSGVGLGVGFGVGLGVGYEKNKIKFKMMWIDCFNWWMNKFEIRYFWSWIWSWIWSWLQKKEK